VDCPSFFLPLPVGKTLQNALPYGFPEIIFRLKYNKLIDSSLPGTPLALPMDNNAPRGILVTLGEKYPILQKGGEQSGQSSFPFEPPSPGGGNR